MEIKFIGQGYNPESQSSVAEELINELNNTEFTSFKCLVAFASHTGVTGLTEHILASKTHINNYKIIVGIDQFGTSKEALESLLDWNVNTYVFYTNQRIIFHPKIYLFEGEDTASVIIGSNNLTQTGLAQNIEGAVKITYNKNLDELNLVSQITNYFNPLLSSESPHLQPISKELIEQLVANGKVKDEFDRRALFRKNNNNNNESVESSHSHPSLTELFGSTSLQRLPAGFSPRGLTSNNNTSPDSGANATIDSPNLLDQPEPYNTTPEWLYTPNSIVLVAEIGGPSRWKQISFAKRNFTTFFELSTTVGARGTIELRYLKNDGSVEAEIEYCTNARIKKSSNYNLEPNKVSYCTAPYDRANRPIIFFIKINSSQFIYHFETNGTSLYNELADLLTGLPGIKRKEVTIDTLRQACPSISI